MSAHGLLRVRRLAELLLQFIAEAAIVSHKTEIGKQRRRRNQQPGDENPAAAAVGIAAHLAEDD